MRKGHSGAEATSIQTPELCGELQSNRQNLFLFYFLCPWLLFNTIFFFIDKSSCQVFQWLNSFVMTADLIDWLIDCLIDPYRGISSQGPSLRPPSNFPTSDFLLTRWPSGRCILWQISTGAHYWSLKFLLFRLSVPCCSAVLPWRQNLSSCGDFKWPVKLQFQGSIRSATLTPGSREENASRRMDAEIFWPPRNVVALNTNTKHNRPARKKGDLWLKQRNVRLMASQVDVDQIKESQRQSKQTRTSDGRAACFSCPCHLD